MRVWSVPVMTMMEDGLTRVDEGNIASKLLNNGLGVPSESTIKLSALLDQFHPIRHDHHPSLASSPPDLTSPICSTRSVIDWSPPLCRFLTFLVGF